MPEEINLYLPCNIIGKVDEPIGFYMEFLKLGIDEFVKKYKFVKYKIEDTWVIEPNNGEISGERVLANTTNGWSNNNRDILKECRKLGQK
jgi:hypothetical protein